MKPWQLRLILGDGAHADADANAAVALVDEEPAISAERELHGQVHDFEDHMVIDVEPFERLSFGELID